MISAIKNFNWRWFLKAVAFCLLIFFILVYAYFCPLVKYGICSKIIFHPEKQSRPWTNKTMAGHAYEDVYFNSPGGKKLHGWYFLTQGAKYTFLFLHGNGQNLAYRTMEMDLLLKTGCNLLIFDYEGYGLSEGEPSVADAVGDSRAAYNYLVEQKHVSPRHVIIFGESLGSAFAANLSRRVECAAVILQCPLASLKRRGCELLWVGQLYPDFLWPEGGLDSVSAFRGEHAPLLVVAGTLDPCIPIAHADDLFNAAQEPKTYVRIEGAGHTGDPKLIQAPQYFKALKNFVDRLSGNSRTTATQLKN